jgi:hypothetical protein
MSTAVKHLRLVHTSSGLLAEKKGKVSRVPIQLTLPLPDASVVLFVHENALSKPNTFHRLLDSVHPHWIFDARVTPRWDILSGTRLQAFKRFSELGAEYVDLFGRIGISSYQSAGANPALWCHSVFDIISEARSPEGPFVFVFDNNDLINVAIGLIPAVVKEAIKAKTEMKISILASN